MDDIFGKMKDAKQPKMPGHKVDARLQLIKSMKKLAHDMMMEEMSGKLGQEAPDAIAVRVVAEGEPEEMSMDEAMDADMNEFPAKEDVLLKAAMASDDDMAEDEMEDEDSEDEMKLRAMLAQSKKQERE